MADSPDVYFKVEHCIDRIIERLGKNIRVALPLGLGKGVLLINALYRRACEDHELKLHVLTALSLEKPRGSSSLEQRFLEPFVERVYAGVPDLDYARDASRQRLPDNVRVSEFFFRAGSALGNTQLQRRYICTNYTHVVRDMLALDVNLVIQMLAPHPEGEPLVSLAGNPDLSLDFFEALRAQREQGREVLIAGELNEELPFMPLDAVLPRDAFDLLLERPEGGYALFSVPPTAIEPTDHLIGLYASSLLRDGGTLQLGIGALGSAVVYSTLLRHRNNAVYQKLLGAVGLSPRHPLVSRWGGAAPFENGLYGCSEMLVDGFLDLYEAGILKREVFADEAFQRLVNQGELPGEPSLAMLDRLREAGLIESPLRARDLDWLQGLGIIRPDVEFKGGQWVREQVSLTPDLDSDEAREQLEAHALGDRLTGGVVAHGGFFLGPRRFYDRLRQMPLAERERFCMTSVNYINHLYDHPLGRQSLKAAQRSHGRFVNSAMMATLGGAVVSDGLEDGRVVSGVGGQYNFVAMAHELPDARSIMLLKSWRQGSRGPESNIRFNYGHCTIPRHLRDIVITEYGIADLRGQPDEVVYQEMIRIADSRFQPELLEQARKAGKVSRRWELPPAWCNNTPEKVLNLVERYQAQHGIFEPYPFGCEFSDQELRLMRVLQGLKRATGTRWGKLATLWRAWREEEPADTEQADLERMGLADVAGWREKLDQRLLVHGLRQLAEGGQ